MNTTQFKIVRAYNTIQKIADGKLPLPVSYKLFRLKKSMLPYFEFQLEEEKKALDECAAIADINNNWTFSTDEDKMAFIQRLNEIGSMEVDAEIETQTIPLSADLELSIADMEALEDFITFE